MNKTLTTAIALPYELARWPVAAVDQRLSQLLPQASAPKAALDKAIGSADKIAGTVLLNPAIARRGADRLERAQQLATAARLEAEAASRREEAAETATAGRERAAAKRRAAEETVVSGLDEAQDVEAAGKRAARKQAAQAAAAKKDAADRRAATRAATAEKRKEKVAAVAEAQEEAAARAAAPDLAEAREAEESAARAKADADRLSDLADAKKQQRQED